MASHLDSSTLRAAGEAVAEAFRSGQYPELKGEPWSRVQGFLVERIRERVPGHSTEDVLDALSAGLHATR